MLAEVEMGEGSGDLRPVRTPPPLVHSVSISEWECVNKWMRIKGNLFKLNFISDFPNFVSKVLILKMARSETWCLRRRVGRANYCGKTVSLASSFRGGQGESISTSASLVWRITKFSTITLNEVYVYMVQCVSACLLWVWLNYHTDFISCGLVKTEKICVT